jgi:CubicO group peptidase (beta-lactamase class C family)
MLRAALGGILLGCLLSLPSGAPAAAEPALVPLPAQPAGTPWPVPEWPAAEPAPADRAALEAALDSLFAFRGRGGLPDTRAALVVHRGRVVAERYAEGFGPASRFQSWSMAKSVTLALVGVLAQGGRLSLDAPAPVPAWQGEGDPRRAITLRQLLQMTAGLDNADGGSDPSSFVARLLFGDLSRDVVAASVAARSIHPPGSHWAYSTATSMILADVVMRTAGGRDALLELLRGELSGPLGAGSLVPEFDAAGNFLGGGFVWASARDWARLGLLFLRGGVFDGRRILPEGFVDFARTRAPVPSNGCFGAHLWLNLEPKEDQHKSLPGGPDSAFFMSGSAGQYVAMLPDRDVVVVRLGELQRIDWPDIARGILAAANVFPPLAGAAP